MELLTLLKELIRKMIKPTNRVGQVVSVEGTVCAVRLLNDVVLEQVRLKAAIDGNSNGVLITPMVGSNCVVGLLENNELIPYLVSCDDFETVVIRSSNGVQLVFNQDGTLELNGNDLGGLIKINELKLQLEKNTQAIGAIQEAFSSWTPVSGDGGAVLKGLSASFQSLPLADLSGIENNKIKHGN